MGFLVGALGGYALGSWVGPRVNVVASDRDASWAGSEADAPDRAGSGRRVDGMLLDERVTRAVREALRERGLVNPRVDVTTVDGVTYLRGRPRDAAEAAAIAATVQATRGVQGVVNELKRLDAEQSESASPRQSS
jgi:osmotically-inducible protein OsmY